MNHAMLFNSPISPEKASRLIALLDLAPKANILDVGCGGGEFLLRVLEHYPTARGLGLDYQPQCIEDALLRREGRVTLERCHFEVADIQKSGLPAQHVDLLLCLGSSHAFAGGESAYTELLKQSYAFLPSGALLLVGESFWQQDPEPEYLAFLGETPGVYRSHAENIHCAEKLGWVPFYATVSNTDEWDHFEWSHRMRIEKKRGANLEQSRAWRDAYLRWGRNTMGFGFYLFQKPFDEASKP